MTIANRPSHDLIAQDSVWENEVSISDIKKVFCTHASESEFKVFCAMGKATNLNPFLREIWMIKYDKNQAAQIFIGRDGYRKAAFRDSNYAGHYVDAVYPGDDFNYNYNDSSVTHKKNMNKKADGVKPIGAYALVHVKRFDRPFYVWVDFAEYNTNKSNWVKMPATMIKKVAEAQALRMACPEILGNTYSGEEQEVIEYNRDKNSASSNKLEKIIEAQVVEEVNPELDAAVAFIMNAANVNQLKEISKMTTNLNDSEKELIRIKYKDKMKELKDNEIEVVPKPAAELEPHEKVMRQLQNAKSSETLDIAADLIRELDADKQTELLEFYAQRREELTT